MRLRLDPRGSVFVVFRQPAVGVDPIVAVTRNGKSLDSDARRKFVIRKALYGVLDDPKRTLDVTRKMAALAEAGTLSVRVWSTLGGDPAPRVKKTLRIDYTIDGQPGTASAVDAQTLSIPSSNAPPWPAALVEARDGHTCLVALEPGHYEAKTAAGQTFACDVALPPPPIDVTGPWDLRFPPRWGAPEHVVLDRLISWTEHADDGVKHFSGTAIYRKTFDLAADRLAGGRSLFLDLGRVAVIAEVKLNGKDLGIFWKPPFRAEITAAARPGVNELEIRVTNLWPNRLIGDERRPPYLTWQGDAPAEWPDWLADGGPVPDTGRYTFTTWHHYTKNSPLLPSGLLGPVILRSAERQSILAHEH